jgi:hypothetical protein
MVVVDVALGNNTAGLTPVVGATVPPRFDVNVAACTNVPFEKVGVVDSSKTYWIWRGVLTTPEETEKVVPTVPLICVLFAGATSLGIFNGVAYPMLETRDERKKHSCPPEAVEVDPVEDVEVEPVEEVEPVPLVPPVVPPVVPVVPVVPVEPVVDVEPVEDVEVEPVDAVVPPDAVDPDVSLVPPPGKSIANSS